MVWTSSEVVGEELHSAATEIRERLEDRFSAIGFRTDDGLRFFRRNGHLIHYFKVIVQYLRKGEHGARTEGNHIGFHFGETLDFTPDMKIRVGEKTSATIVEENTDVYSFAKRDHYAKTSDKIHAAISEIDERRWSQVRTEENYADFHLRGRPSMEKVYLLTLSGSHAEADAWLHLLLHKHRAIRTISEVGPDNRLKTYSDQPAALEIEFSRQSNEDRVKSIRKEIEKTIQLNGIGFLYETV